MTEKKSVTRIFLIRGLSREIRHWGPFLDKLANSFPHATIHPLEIPGTGELRNQTSPTTIEKYVLALRQQYLHHTTPTDDCKIIGLSLGGMIAAHWGSYYPYDFNAAVLINSSCRISQPFRRMLISGGAHLLWAMCHTDPLQREKKIASLVCNLADHDETARKWSIISRTAPVLLLNFLRQLYAAAKFRPPSKNEVPTLILCSKRDRLVSYKSSEDIASYWNKEIIYHEQAGHDLPTDDPEWCLKQLLRWRPFTSLNTC